MPPWLPFLVGGAKQMWQCDECGVCRFWPRWPQKPISMPMHNLLQLFGTNLYRARDNVQSRFDNRHIYFSYILDIDIDTSNEI